MSAWAPKRFWTAAAAVEVEGGFSVQLDTRVVKTPAKAAFVLPSRVMAEAIAVEWDAQSGLIKPETMPLTRAANSAIDKVAVLHEGVVDEISGFGGSDLLCYRAEQPIELANRQAAGWDPLLAWAEEAFAASLNVTTGIMPVEQPPESQARLRAAVHAQTPFQLAALHDLVAITGSLILGLAVARERLSADEAFALSRIDETWQIEQWGDDEEAAALETKRMEALRCAARFYGLCG